MEAAFAWLGQLMTTIGSIFPTWQHVECVDAAVMIKRGRIVQKLHPGIYWYWPFWTTIYTQPRKPQTKILPNNPIITADRQRVTVGGIVKYELVDDVLALVEAHDIDDIVVDESVAVLCQFITERALDDIQTNRAQVNDALTVAVRQWLTGYGVNVLRAQLTAFSPAIVLTHVNNHNTEQAPVVE